MKLIFACYCLLLLPVCLIYSNDEIVDGRSICLIIREDFRGEQEFAERIKIACKNLNWKVTIVNFSAFVDLDPHYDWILTLVPGKESISKENDYLILFDPVHHFFNMGRLKKEYLDYAGYLTTYSNTDLLLKDVKYQNRVYHKRWYPSVQYRPYQTVNPTRLFYFIGHWGNRRDDIKYQKLQHELAKRDYTNLYGKPAFGITYGPAFKGPIEFDGESVINLISELGVSLILHSETHRNNKIPSGRIFEAAAASAVIISDLNPFIIEHFGDSVLYIDQDLSGEEMFEQIDAFMIWIQTHPEEALLMAQRAHQIFEENFLLESQLLDFDMWHSARR
jgi:hypothetical protein